MKNYIVLSIINNIFYFEYRFISDDEVDHVNTNTLYKSSLYYELKYFKQNLHVIMDVLKKIKASSIKTLCVNKLVDFKYVTIIMNGLDLEILKIDIPSTLSLSAYDHLLSIKYLKQIDCYFMPDFIVKKFNEKKVKINMFNKKIISEDFLLSQDIFDYDTLYYKKDITITCENDKLFEDIKEFLRINYNLKVIHIKYFSKSLMEKLIELLKYDESKNVVLYLYQSSDKGGFITENFEWFRKINQECKEEEICEFRILYSNSFVVNNLFKQLTFNNLKLIFILGVYVCVVSLLIFKSYAYVEELNVNKLNNDLMSEIDNDEEQLNDGEVDSEETIEEVKDKYKIDKVFATLKKTNNETVGFLVVNNTNINYPVVKHDDNSYYLKRDFYKKKTSMGWVFMDYRNNSKELDDNTIIYGHNMKNATMFGTLKKVLSSSWRKIDENMIISYDTDKIKYKFKIFSIYKVNYTTDYLRTSFDAKDEFVDFINLIKGRSIFKSKEKIEFGDKILTLSTCTGSNNKRLVVHAKMISEEAY